MYEVCDDEEFVANDAENVEHGHVEGIERVA